MILMLDITFIDNLKYLEVQLTVKCRLIQRTVYEAFTLTARWFSHQYNRFGFVGNHFGKE